MTDIASRTNRLLTMAVAARKRGDLGEEYGLLQQALIDNPHNPQLHNALGMHALATGEGDRARDHFATASTLDPREPILWINLATAQRLRGDDAGERAALDRALDIDRLHFTAHLRVAELQERTGDTIGAAQSWSAVVQMAMAIPQPSPAILDAMARGRAFLDAHNASLGKRIDDRLGDTIAALGAGSSRITACIDHMLGRRAIYANACAGIHFPFLPALEFFDRAAFPWFAELEARTAAIRREAQALITEGVSSIRPYIMQDAGTPANKWSALDRNADWSACFLWEYGVRNDEVCDRCPETVAALSTVPQTDIPGKAPTAFFSILKPHAHIPAHTGVTNTRTIVHLPLIVPDRCRFRVGGETRSWQEGHAFAFDDTIEHEAWNDSEEPRVVLILDVWNPFLTPAEQAMLKEIFQLTAQPGA